MEVSSSSGSQRMRSAAMRGGRLLAAVMLCAALLPGTALADERDDAKRHFVAASEAYKAGDYTLALEEFLAANDILAHPNNLYNIARTTEKLGDLDGALGYYRDVVEQSPETNERAEAAIARLEEALAVVVVEAPAAAPAGSATAEEIERLRAIAAELEALGERLRARPLR